MVLSSCEDNPKKPPPPVLYEPYIMIDMFGAWAPDGHTIAYFHSDSSLLVERSGLFIIDTNGTNKIQLTFADIIGGIDWSPDGNWIVFGSHAQICKIKRNGDSLTQLTSEGSNYFPSWSPGGIWIVYDSNYEDSSGANVIWKITYDGNYKVDISQHGVGEWRMPSWLPDGMKIIHQRFIGVGAPEIYTMDTSGHNPVRLTFDTDWWEELPKYSPDGSLIAFSAMPVPGIACHLSVMNSDGTNKHQISIHGYAPDWSPDGKMIIYTNTSTNSGMLWIMDKDGNNKKQVTF